jgi:2-methylcitrate dehydratase PrpD
MSSLTDQIVSLTLETKPSDFPTPVLDATKRVVLDTLACTVGAFSTDPGAVVAALKRAQGGTAEATLAVCGDRLPVASVAYVHAQLANLLDGDETLMTRWHIAAAIVGPAVAAAEQSRAPGSELLAAVALGYDVAARVAQSLCQVRLSAEGSTHRSTVVGYDWAVFGTTAAVGRLLGLSGEQLARAFGIAFVTTPVNYDLVRHNEKSSPRARRWIGTRTRCTERSQRLE